MIFGKRKAARVAVGGDDILVVDDEPDLCQCLAISLRGHGFAVRTASDGEAGLRAMHESTPRLVLLDIMMPRLNGYQVLAKMQQDANLAQIPVFVMTSLTEESDHSDEEWAKRLGVVRFFAKPFDTDTVAEAVRAELQSGARLN